jgi:hypothetical protein
VVGYVVVDVITYLALNSSTLTKRNISEIEPVKQLDLKQRSNEAVVNMLSIFLFRGSPECNTLRNKNTSTLRVESHAQFMTKL